MIGHEVDVAAWLAGKPGVPVDLARRVLDAATEAARAHAGSDLPTILAEAACGRLRVVLGAGAPEGAAIAPPRAAALDLLAADALLTYACEAAAAAGEARLDALVEAYGPDTLSGLLESAKP